MAKPSFYLVDVFAERKYAGNQLAVITGAAGFSGDRMQAVARELNFSETAFIMDGDPESGLYDVRIFTPLHEVPFAGHPTLGTAYIIRQELHHGADGPIVLNLKAGRIPVTVAPDSQGAEVYWMRQLAPSFGSTLPAAAMAPVLGLAVAEIDERFPIQQVSTGLPHIIVPLKQRRALREIRVVRELYFPLVEATWAKNLQVFCAEADEPGHDISTRMFADYLGVPEDPATGSGNGCLAGYLLQHRYFGEGPLALKSEQGYDMGRPSLLYLQAEWQAGEIAIRIGGSVVPVAQGVLV